MKPRILIADDDRKSLILLTDKLQSDGYTVEGATNGTEVLEKIDTFHPDLIILDIMMPRIDGYEILRVLKSREATRYIPVILLTAKTQVEEKVMGIELGAEDYIVKPYSLQELSARVKSLLRMRALQRRLRDTEKMAALGEMVDGIAHEIRNPLTTIGGIARRLYEIESDEKKKSYMGVIIRSVERMEKMLARIAEYKWILYLNPSRGNINEVIEKAVDEVRELIDGKEIDIKIDLMPDPPPVNIDFKNMKIAIFNILQNSIEAIERKGEIKIETLPSEDQTIIVRISDTGSGIKREDLRKIFYPFVTSKMTGAGLGLTITSRIIHDHGGEIEVESVEGKGTTFTIKLHPLRETSNNVYLT